LLENPEAGDVESGTGGLGKIRLGDPTRGLIYILLPIKRSGDKETRA
jgi:hypothetical protein